MREPKPEQAAAKKRFGQHFLTDPRILARIADAVGIAEGDTVVEIGPGRGALTEHLATRVGQRGRLIAVEVDRHLAADLRQRYADDSRVTIIEGDVLETSFAELLVGPFLLAGNIPYNITTPLIFRALKPPRAERIVFLVQREVADRLAAPPGSESYGALSANAQALATIETVFKVPAGAFNPPPKVESTVIRVVPRADPAVTQMEEAPFRALVTSLFSFRRKQMARAVRETLGIDAAAAADLLSRALIRPTDRPEVLAPADFARLLRAATQ